MLIQKGVSKEYVDVYLQNRIKTQKQEAEKMKEFCQKHIIRIHGGTILDLAGGPGVDTNIFCQLGAKKVIYHDKYKEYIETAKKINQKYTDSIEFHQGDINEIDYIQNNSIDLIYCNVSFFYSKNDRKLLKDLEKKLKIGGNIIINTYDIKKFKKQPLYWKILFRLPHILYRLIGTKIITLPYNDTNKLIHSSKSTLNVIYKNTNILDGYYTQLLWRKTS